MDFTEIFQLYHKDPPYSWEYKDTSRGEEDFRRTVFPEWADQRLVIKIACNDFTSPRRVQIWQKTAAAYSAMGVLLSPDHSPVKMGIWRRPWNMRAEPALCTRKSGPDFRRQTSLEKG